MKKVIFLNKDEFAKAQGEARRLPAGFGTGRSVEAVKRTADGNYFVKLSPIADTSYNGESQEINPTTEKNIEWYLRNAPKWF